MKETYKKIKKRIDLLDFQSIFKGFHPFQFALYNDKVVQFENDVIPYDNRFIGNSSIKYNDEHIAIWNMNYPVEDINQFASKIVHEMFHAFQGEKNEQRFPNEICGIFYNFSKENIGMKIEETKYLINSYIKKDKSELFKFLMLRSKRRALYIDSVNYEAGIETVEGYARFIELKTLKKFSEEKYSNEFNKLLKYVDTFSNYSKPRNISYEVGALLLTLLEDFGYDISIDFPRSVTVDLYVKPDKKTSVKFNNNLDLKWLDDLNNQSSEMLKNLLSKSLEKVEFDKVIGFDPMNTKKIENYIVYNHFIFIEHNQKRFSIMGRFLMKLNKENEFVDLYKIID